MRILIFASGRGSNFEAIEAGIRSSEIKNAEIIGVFSNKPKAPVLEKARGCGIPTHVVPSKDFYRDKRLDRVSYESEVLVKLQSLDPDLICLAGYMLLLGPTLLEHWRGRIINIHPSLLPKHKGLNAQQQAIDAGDKEAGCTVHFVTPEMDEGPIVEQRSISIENDETAESLAKRLLPIEHACYRSAVARICAGEFELPAKF